MFNGRIDDQASSTCKLIFKLTCCENQLYVQALNIICSPPTNMFVCGEKLQGLLEIEDLLVVLAPPNTQ